MCVLFFTILRYVGSKAFVFFHILFDFIKTTQSKIAKSLLLAPGIRSAKK